jgi:prevent-host-death family protein
MILSNIKEMICVVVTSTDLKIRTGELLDKSRDEDIIITRNGKEVAKLISLKKAGTTPNADFIYGLMSDCKDKNITKEKIREERLSEKHESSD